MDQEDMNTLSVNGRYSGRAGMEDGATRQGEGPTDTT